MLPVNTLLALKSRSKDQHEHAISNIGGIIEEVYNRKRLHSSLGYKCPEDFEMEVGLKGKYEIEEVTKPSEKGLIVDV